MLYPLLYPEYFNFIGATERGVNDRYQPSHGFILFLVIIRTTLSASLIIHNYLLISHSANNELNLVEYHRFPLHGGFDKKFSYAPYHKYYFIVKAEV